MYRENEWLISNRKRLMHKQNKDFVTARALIVNGKKVIKISIGLNVCELIGFKRGDRVHLFIHKENRDFLAIQKDISCQTGYKLSSTYHIRNASFMTFEFRYQTEESFKLSQTIILDYDFQEENTLIVDLYKLKWRD